MMLNDLEWPFFTLNSVFAPVCLELKCGCRGLSENNTDTAVTLLRNVTIASKWLRHRAVSMQYHDFLVVILSLLHSAMNNGRIWNKICHIISCKICMSNC